MRRLSLQGGGLPHESQTLHLRNVYSYGGRAPRGKLNMHRIDQLAFLILLSLLRHVTAAILHEQLACVVTLNLLRETNLGKGRTFGKRKIR